jgi:hypothetical protein
MCRKIGGEEAASLTETNPRSSEESLGHRLAVGDVRFAGVVAVGLVGGVLAIGALASPMLGWSGSTASVLPEHEQTVRLGEPPAAARRAGVAPGSPDPARRTARRERRKRAPRVVRQAGHQSEVGLQPATVARRPAGVTPKPASVRTRIRSGRAVARPDVRAPRWRLPSRPAAGVPPPPQAEEAPVEAPPVAPPGETPVLERPPPEPPADAEPPAEPLVPERPPAEDPAPVSPG